MSRWQVARLSGGRLHLNDGPIDLVISSDGRRDEVARAEAAAIARFATVLDELCAELPALRAPAGAPLRGGVARRMGGAVAPFAADHFITPMAAVAGAVAEEILAAMLAAAPLARASVNNGGDIAFHLAPGRRYRLGLMDRPDQPTLFATAEIASADIARGVATSGWRGRSFSLGIADAVTVLAPGAAVADAAATLIANAVDLPGHPAVRRMRARDLQPDSDLGERRVTIDVASLGRREIDAALAAGAAQAQDFVARGLVVAAALRLQGVTRSLSPHAPATTERLAHA